MRSHTHGRETKSLGRSRVTHKEALTWNSQEVTHPEYVTPPTQDTITTQVTKSRYHRTRFAQDQPTAEGFPDKPYCLTTTTTTTTSQLHSKLNAVH